MFQWRPWQVLYGMESLSDRVAQRCREAVLERVLPEAAAMTTAEARGYVRARASGVVLFHSAVLLAELGAPKELGPKLVTLAKQRVVALVLAELRKQRQTADFHRRAA